MPGIHLLEQSTIDKIAAGEVVERPSSVVKELVENAIDAKATAITVEIKNGGISLIRITDNGCGISKGEISMAFLRHSTSKIRSVEDLVTITSLGFRGEALSSIAAVAQVELITKPQEDLTGCRYLIEGSEEKSLEEIGAPNGTTFLIKNLFYNTPARQKFLKTPQTEASYISSLMEHLALSHPDISFRFIVNGQIKLNTSGNGNQKEIIYHIYGREIAANLVEIHNEEHGIKVDGFIGKPIISRGNRNFENYFINGRYIKSSLILKAIEDAYKNHLMQHQYPFTVLNINIEADQLDINVHPTKMELRFSNGAQIYQFLSNAVIDALTHKDFIPNVSLEPEAKEVKISSQTIKKIEPFEVNRIRKQEVKSYPNDIQEKAQIQQLTLQEAPVYEQHFLEEASKPLHRIIGQIFDTYWLVEFEEKLFIIDQHAAHEKVLFEKMMYALKEKEFTSQQLSPPLVVSLTMREEELLNKYYDQFLQLGYQIESFGGKEYSICAVPANLYNINKQSLFVEMLDELSEETGLKTSDIVLNKIASMSCKAAVKGNQRLSFKEMEHLIDELLQCENPYQCPHGRPTIISMSKYELEKKFKRIL